ncbi:MAG: prepilin-type N-terminal cleavage/methylation domain-containing protein [Planctomycetes bacterium]|nr:prepilin-type N-terminal cleavage/methylation domain-containing protein [Planctomycetota bacterium]
MNAAVKKGVKARIGFTVIEVLLALTILAILLSAVALAMQGGLKCFDESEQIAQLIQTSQVVLNRMMSEVRTAQAVDTDTQRISIIPPENDEGITNIEYELVDGVLYYRQTINGEQTSQELISSDDVAKVISFTVSRETAIGEDDLIYTRSVTATLKLQAGDNQFAITASACPRRNMNY